MCVCVFILHVQDDLVQHGELRGFTLVCATKSGDGILLAFPPPMPSLFLAPSHTSETKRKGTCVHGGIGGSPWAGIVQASYNARSPPRFEFQRDGSFQSWLGSPTIAFTQKVPAPSFFLVHQTPLLWGVNIFFFWLLAVLKCPHVNALLLGKWCWANHLTAIVVSALMWIHNSSPLA